MRWLRYAGMILCIVLIIGSLVPAFLIVTGLAAGNTEDSAYFVAKLAGHIAIIVVLALVAVKLYRGAKLRAQ
jgi:hypothetical protein